MMLVRGEEEKEKAGKLQAGTADKPPRWVGIEKDHKIRRRKADNHNHNSYNVPVYTPYRSQEPPLSNSYGSPPPPPSISYGSPAPSASYGSPAAPADEGGVDLHNEEFCVDVSTYQPVVWVERDGEECKTEFVKQCEDKTEEVCAEVTETRCEVNNQFL